MTAVTKNLDWRTRLTDADPDDEELAQTPQDVVDALGFDPKDEAVKPVNERMRE